MAEKRISSSGGLALYLLAGNWSGQYSELCSELRFNVLASGAEKGPSYVPSGSVDLGMISRRITQAEKDKSVWWVAVADHAVLRTISVDHPDPVKVRSSGMTQAHFKSVFIGQYKVKRSEAVKGGTIQTVEPYNRSDAYGEMGDWADCSGAKQENLKGAGVIGDQGSADAVTHDRFWSEYSNSVFMYHIRTGGKVTGTEVVFIDIDGNGKLDPNEDYYTDIKSVPAAISDGRYPSPPARVQYFYSKSKPHTENVEEVLRWTLNEGLRCVTEAGYVTLTEKVMTIE